MDELDAPVLLLRLVRNGPVDELEENPSFSFPNFDVGVPVADPTADADDFCVGHAALVLELVEDDDDGDGGGDEAVSLAPATPVEAPVLGDAVHRLLLYVDFLRFRAELVHALSRLIRYVVQRLFRVVQKIVGACSCGIGQFFYLRVQLPYHPFQTLATLAGIGANVLRQHILHVSVEGHPFDLYGGLLLQQCFARIRRMRHVAERFVHRHEAAKGEVDRLECHLLLGRIHRGVFTGVAYVRRTDQLLGPLWKVPFGTDEAMRVEDTVDNPSLDHIGADHCRIDWIRVLAPGCLGHGFPWVVEYVF